MIAAGLFDSQGKVINYADQPEAVLEPLGSGQTRDIKLGVAALGQAVARYELRAWGSDPPFLQPQQLLQLLLGSGVAVLQGQF